MLQILRDAEVPAPCDLESYQESDWPALAACLLLAAAALATLILPLALSGWGLGWWFAVPVVCALLALLIARWAWGNFHASRALSGWRLRWSAEDLYLRFRSPLNHRFPAESPAVFRLPRRAVAWLGVHRERLSSPDREGGSRFVRVCWLEVALKDVDPAPILAALAAEARQRDPGGGRHNDAPIVLIGDDRLRIKLRHPEEAAARLARFYPVTQATAREADAFDDLSAEDKEAQILGLAQAGQSIAAVKAARDLYGYDLTEAKLFVDGLMGR